MIRVPAIALMACAAVATLTGCAAVAVGGATATGAALAHDRRSSTAILNDQAIEMNAGLDLNQQDDIRDGAHINVTAYNGAVLVTGEARNAAVREKIIEIVRRLPDVKLVYNQVEIAEPTDLGSRSQDSLLTAKVKTALLDVRNLAGFDPTRVKVVTENATVFLMGLVRKIEGKAAADSASRVEGVKRVVKLFEYID